MKGCLRMIIGTIMIFGYVGAMETNPNMSMTVPLFWIVVGIAVLVSGTKSMLENN